MARTIKQIELKKNQLVFFALQGEEEHSTHVEKGAVKVFERKGSEESVGL